jgi:hypothetical protein
VPTIYCFSGGNLAAEAVTIRSTASEVSFHARETIAGDGQDPYCFISMPFASSNDHKKRHRRALLPNADPKGPGVDALGTYSLTAIS